MLLRLRKEALKPCSGWCAIYHGLVTVAILTELLHHLGLIEAHSTEGPEGAKTPGACAHRAGLQAVWRHFENCSSISTTCRVRLHALRRFRTRVNIMLGAFCCTSCWRARRPPPSALRHFGAPKRSCHLVPTQIPAFPSSAAHTSSMDSSSSAFQVGLSSMNAHFSDSKKQHCAHSSRCFHAASSQSSVHPSHPSNVSTNAVCRRLTG